MSRCDYAASTRPRSNGRATARGTFSTRCKTAINDWHVNVIRLPLAQDRWFGKGPEQKDEGKAYRGLVSQVVEFCAGRDCYVILDLHWSDAGEWGKQIGQHVMPDQNSVEFWKSCATSYKNHPAVIFDLYNEPHDVTWDIWKNGGQVSEKADRREPGEDVPGRRHAGPPRHGAGDGREERRDRRGPGLGVRHVGISRRASSLPIRLATA